MAAIKERRTAAKARFEAALKGDDLTEIKTTHDALRATDTETQTARLALAAKLRHGAELKILQSTQDLSERRKSVSQHVDDMAQLIDTLIEGVAKF